MYNRRQRALWIDRQLEELQNARLAYTNGTATEAQLEILRNEKIGEIAKQKRDEAKEQRLWNRTKRYLLSGLNQEDSASTASTAGATALEASPLLASTDKIGVLDALEAKKMENAFAKSSSASASALSTPSQQSTSTITTASSSSSPSPSSGLTVNAESTKQTSRSWTSWITGR